jgi:hypothetical protein
MEELSVCMIRSPRGWPAYFMIRDMFHPYPSSSSLLLIDEEEG